MSLEKDECTFQRYLDCASGVSDKSDRLFQQIVASVCRKIFAGCKETQCMKDALYQLEDGNLGG